MAKTAIVHIYNFIRMSHTKPSRFIPDDFETLREQLILIKQYGFPGTYALKYDALMDYRYQTLLKEYLVKWDELCAWWEITKPLCRRAGIRFRDSRDDLVYDDRVDSAHSPGYEPEERKRCFGSGTCSCTVRTTPDGICPSGCRQSDSPTGKGQSITRLANAELSLSTSTDSAVSGFSHGNLWNRKLNRVSFKNALAVGPARALTTLQNRMPFHILQDNDIMDWRWVHGEALKDHLHRDTYEACASLLNLE